jgi:hypothetical protein
VTHPFVPKGAELLYLGAEMSNVASICSEFGIAVVAPAKRRAGGTALETRASATLQTLLSDWGESHLREVLLSIVESKGNDRALTAPVIMGCQISCSRTQAGLAAAERQAARHPARALLSLQRAGLRVSRLVQLKHLYANLSHAAFRDP